MCLCGSLSVSLSLRISLSLYVSLSLSRTHPRTHSPTLSLSLTFSLFLGQSLSFSLWLRIRARVKLARMYCFIAALSHDTHVHGQLEVRHATRLEWIVIWLIVAEVGLEVVWNILIKDILVLSLSRSRCLALTLARAFSRARSVSRSPFGFGKNILVRHFLPSCSPTTPVLVYQTSDSAHTCTHIHRASSMIAVNEQPNQSANLIMHPATTTDTAPHKPHRVTHRV